MLLRLPPALATSGKKSRKNAALYAWLNRLREAVAACEAQIPHNLQTIEGPNGVSYIGDLGAADETPDETEEAFDDCICSKFTMSWMFAQGGAREPELIHAVHAEAFNVPRPIDSGVERTYWVKSGVRMTRKIALPFHIRRIEITVDRVPERTEFDASGLIDLTKAIAPTFNFGLESGLAGRTLNLGSCDGSWAADAGNRQPLVYRFEINTNVEVEEPQQHVYGLLCSKMAGPDVASLRERFIVPGTVVTVNGFIEGRIRRF